MIRRSLISFLVLLASPAMAQMPSDLPNAMAELSEMNAAKCEALDIMMSRVDLQSFANGSKPRIEEPTSLADLYMVVTAPMCAAATAYDEGWMISITPLVVDDAPVMLFEEQSLDGSYRQQSVLMFEREEAGWTPAVDLCATAEIDRISFCSP